MYYNLISTHGSLSLAFAALCKCDLEISQAKCLPLPVFADILSEQFPHGAFDAAVHNLVWDSASSEVITRPLFCAVISRAPVLLPYQSCRTMLCILSLCKSNSISCNELFVQYDSSDDGFLRRSEYAQTNTYTFSHNFCLLETFRNHKSLLLRTQ